MKKRGFGQGKWNGLFVGLFLLSSVLISWKGPGGKVEDKESIEEAVIRECEEETGLTPINPKKVGILDFIFHGNEHWNNQCHVFIANSWSGSVAETEGCFLQSLLLILTEMKPQWFDFYQIPYQEMWPDDLIWMPKMLAGEPVYYTIEFDNQSNMISCLPKD